MRSSRTSWCSLLLLVAGGSTLLTTSCGPSTTSSSSAAPPEGEPDPLKVAYYRAYPEPKTQRLEASYRAVMSQGWKDRVGESPREVLMKAAPKKVFTGFLSDAELRRYVKLLKDNGLEKMKAVDSDSFNPQEFHQRALHPKESEFTRVITVATDKVSRSYYYRDQQSSPELINTFRQCEKIIARITEYSMKVEVIIPEKDRVIPRDR
jgi:hypothetical protein